MRLEINVTGKLPIYGSEALSFPDGCFWRSQIAMQLTLNPSVVKVLPPCQHNFLSRGSVARYQALFIQEKKARLCFRLAECDMRQLRPVACCSLPRE